MRDLCWVLHKELLWQHQAQDLPSVNLHLSKSSRPVPKFPRTTRILRNVDLLHSQLLRPRIPVAVGCAEPGISRAPAHPTPQVLTCLAATLDEPTMFPLLSSTSIPSSSSVCLIRTTLQMLALAEEEKGRRISPGQSPLAASVCPESPPDFLPSVC